MKFSDEQKRIARDAVEAYQRRVEMMWDDLKFELELELNLNHEDVDQLLMEAT